MTSAVQEQYEAYPYPERRPEDENSRLMVTWPEQLAQINHYCYRGRQDFTGGFRVLVAGGGTGDATLYLAEQLRDAGAEIVHLDLSHASLDIARRRAQVRQLENVRFVHGSLLELPSLGLGVFDYISCTGVLHHLRQPELGLKSLLSALAPEGAMNVLLYGRLGRAAIYQLQELMRIVNRDALAMEEKLRRARTLLASLPSTHAWRRHRTYRDGASIEDAEIYDLFLHAQDRAYSVPEILEWFERSEGLHLQFSRLGVGRLGYQPQSYIADPVLLERVAALSAGEQAAVAELLAGDIDLHCFFATRSPGSAASLDELDNVPFFYGGFEQTRGAEIAALMDKHPATDLELRDSRSGLTGRLPRGKHTRELFRHLDGERTLRDIYRRAGGSAADAAMRADFQGLFEVLNAVDGMLLRHASVARFPTAAELSGRVQTPQQ